MWMMLLYGLSRVYRPNKDENIGLLWDELA